MSTAIPADAPINPRTAVAIPRLPSIEEITKDMQEKMPGLWIYNPSNLWIQLQVFGLTHIWAIPDLGGRRVNHPITGKEIVCNGRTELKGRFFKWKDSSGKDVEGQDAGSMVKVVVSPENYGQMGIVWLSGESPESDLRMIEKSQAVWATYREAQDEDTVNKRAEFKANWEKNPRHKGEPCPPPTAAEMSALDRISKRRRQLDWKYVCPVSTCIGYASNEWDQFTTHMAAQHNRLDIKREQFEGGGLTIGDLVRQSDDAEKAGVAVADVAANNAAVLQLLKELKLDNDRLQERLVKLEGKGAATPTPVTSTPASIPVETASSRPPGRGPDEDEDDDDNGNGPDNDDDPDIKAANDKPVKRGKR